ncbi:MAG TPA: right-handed parallel beta-helix repeat-containing protein [Anaerolineae bacterium]
MKKQSPMPPPVSPAKPNDPIFVAWKSQLAQAAKKPWLASLLLQQSQLIFGRFAHYYRLLRVLPRRTRRRFLKGTAGTLGSLALLLALSGTPALANNIAVTTNVITPIDGDNECSLIEAILNANDTGTGQPYLDCAAGDPSGPDTITLAGNTYTFSVIDNTDYGATGLPTISSTVTIQGNGATLQRSGAAPSFRLMAVGASGDLTLDNVAVTGGATPGRGGGIYSYEGGLTIINNSVISGNTADEGGGGVASYDYNNPATVTIENSAISGNSAYYGGGVFNASYYDAANLTLSNSTVSGNTAPGPGGGVYNASYYGSAVTTIQDSLISSNDSDEAFGGGVSNVSIFGAAAVTIDNSTVSGNNAYYAGGGTLNGTIFAESSLTIRNNSVISGNTSTYGAGGGAANYSYVVTATTSIDNSLITGNSAYAIGGGSSNYSLVGQAKFTLTNSQVTNNSVAQFDGGGISNAGKIYDFEPERTSSRVTLSGNPPHRDEFDSSKWREVDGAMVRHHKRAVIAGTLSGTQDLPGLGLLNKPAPLTNDSSTISSNSAGDDDTTTTTSQETRDRRWRHNRALAADKMTLVQSALEKQMISATALDDAATMTIDNSTISGNSARDGGGVSNYSYFGSISLTIQNNSVLSGNMASGVDSDGGGVYNNTIYGDALVTIDNSTISGNTAVADNAGGIYNYTISGTATIMVNDSIVTGNNSGDDGAGLYSFSYYGATSMVIRDSTISDNAALENGGAMYNLAITGTATIALDNSTISGNSAGESGGGVYNLSVFDAAGVTIETSTLSGNNAVDNGGGLYNYSPYGSATSVITNSTISGNSANQGGGIYQNVGTGELNHVTVTNNSATTTGGGLYIANPGVFTLLNSMVAGNAGGGDCSGSINSGGYNLDSDGTCITNGVNNDITSATLVMGSLQVNSPGDTATHALFFGSPALDQIPAGTNGCGTIFVTDQRGLTRPLDGDLDGVPACDMGAYESNGLNRITYLPIILKIFVPGPDLVIVPDSLVATTSGVTLTIRNAGTTPVVDAFWVDVYYNLASPPVLNQQGPIFWGLSVPNDGIPILPGETVTLTFASPYFLSPASLPAAGSTIYGQVDAVGPFSYGAVNETNEGNNVSGPTISTTASGSPIQTDKSGSNTGGLPARD